ncbi:MAG: hypothetical protein FWG21_00030 [Oscillospiraceae bacterium]|nr:hypothetical protein [Oscillospiraceae bacterium]
MGNMGNILGDYLLIILAAITIENVVFTRAMGLSRVISLVDNVRSTVIFCILLSLTTALSSVIYYSIYHSYIDRIENATIFRVLILVLVMSVIYLLVFITAIKIIPYEHIGKAAEAMPTATFNSMVFGVIMLSSIEQMTLSETIVYSIGSSIGYTLAIIYVVEGQRKLQSRDIPAAFKGLPVTLLYLAGLAMAIYSLTGRIFTL